ncbi:MAG: hypothetical protein ACJ8DK_19005 [Microvirga sp.]
MTQASAIASAAVWASDRQKCRPAWSVISHDQQIGCSLGSIQLPVSAATMAAWISAGVSFVGVIDSGFQCRCGAGGVGALIAESRGQ